MEELKGSLYDDIDMRNAYNTGFWVGTISGGIGVFVLCFLAGYFLT